MWIKILSESFNENTHARVKVVSSMHALHISRSSRRYTDSMHLQITE